MPRALTRSFHHDWARIPAFPTTVQSLGSPRPARQCRISPPPQARNSGVAVSVVASSHCAVSLLMSLWPQCSAVAAFLCCIWEALRRRRLEGRPCSPPVSPFLPGRPSCAAYRLISAHRWFVKFLGFIIVHDRKVNPTVSSCIMETEVSFNSAVSFCLHFVSL